MFYIGRTNGRINYLQEIALTLIYDDYKLTFEELLKKDGLYKVYHKLSQTIVSNLFMRNSNSYHLILKSNFVIPKVRRVLKGSNSIRFYDPNIWNLVLEEIRYTNSLENFKNKIRRWKANDCPCRLCKNGIPNVGFLEILELYFKCKIIFGVLFVCNVSKFWTRCKKTQFFCGLVPNVSY